MNPRFTRRNAMSAALAAAAICAAQPALAQFSDDTVKIGFITDMSGVLADTDGPGGVTAIKMAIDDFGGTVNGKKIEFRFADHQNKADVAASKAREWFDQDGLDMLIGGTNSSAALAMSGIAAAKHKPLFVIAAGTARLTNEECTPYTVHYAYDTVAAAKVMGSQIVELGGKSWYFLTADYAFGKSLEADTSKVVKSLGGNIVGSTRFPLGASDFSSFIVQAQTSKAAILALATSGDDTNNSIKAANEFGATKTMKLAGLLMYINDIQSLSLAQAKGLYLTESWYWDQSDASRKWAERYFAKMKKMPSSLQAADYSATTQYLNAVKAVNSDDPAKVLPYMHKMKIDDMYTKDGTIRDDGRMVHDMFLFQVKSPEESKRPWDDYKLVKTVAGDQAFTSKADSACKLWK